MLITIKAVTGIYIEIYFDAIYSSSIVFVVLQKPFSSGKRLTIHQVR